MRLLVVWALLMGASVGIRAQDAVRQQFYGNESSFNPAFTGQTGATRLTAGVRSQWGGTDNSGTGPDAYRGRYLTYEEALPCMFFDYGLFVQQNEQGAGGLTTTEIGGRLAVAVPILKRSVLRATNLRVGLGLSRGQHRIDYAGLTFLDQYTNVGGNMGADGRPLQSAFLATQSNESPWYSSTSLGVSLKGGIKQRPGKRTDRPLTYDVGLAVHNWGGLVTEDARQTSSLSGLDAPLSERWVASARANAVVARRNRRYWSVHPLLIVQRQNQLSYVEAGTGVSWNRHLELGVYHHLAQLEGEGANWTSVRTVFGSVLPDDYTRLDLGLSWSFQYGSLKNYVQAPFELTATFSFARSVSCMAMGRENDFTQQRAGRISCYNFSTSGHRIYDNIWN
ncbi:hypothetical protein LEM8419_02951 [Neolewinella maritima]|uniref:Type IX secretion system membrane protein PorP/SprF n=1 Tax=Neolewinella maritima TaxID=1383882 RepID=A0ABM9B3X6_9BACT|nr:type IX secretion system membrane protein PorP/SprF [Neolewinella maritima]CAH1002036.1 hypothetical protein LEM8419_02951 [Neolewinella maritima]